MIARGVTAAMSAQLFERAVAGAKEALEHFRVLGDRVGEARALSNIAAASVRLSHWQEAREANIAAAAISDSIGDRHGAARAKMNLGSLLARCGDLAGARTLMHSAREHHVRSGDRRALTASFINEGFMALWQGDAHAARVFSIDALRLAREMDNESFISASLANLGAAERDLGDLDAALAHMQEGLAIVVRLDRLSDAVGDLADVALAHAMKGDLATARARCEQILAIDEAWTKSAVFPPYPLWIVACILHWSGDERADELCAWAWRLATTFAESIDVAELRARFEALPFFEAMRAVQDKRGWPALPATVRIAHASALS